MAPARNPTFIPSWTENERAATYFIRTESNMIYGYDNRTVNEYGLKELREVSIAGDAQTIRALASFLTCMAEEMEKADGSVNWHRHVDNNLRGKLGCDLIVMFDTTDA